MRAPSLRFLAIFILAVAFPVLASATPPVQPAKQWTCFAEGYAPGPNGPSQEIESAIGQAEPSMSEAKDSALEACFSMGLFECQVSDCVQDPTND